ncbi:hypothetical protein [Rhizobium favelukesii]|uniref:Conserved protein n=1 Tax=Rhizobium favelukesii TaxID=348824 RepID=W6RAK2_9HYPH|nr:hypothetical protein [Rhizobium favelukesii]MCS0459320.1 hypothetical protein [Rhizobium favelukesii]CDM57380.1 putative conserved protein [Rhizobium favelukesii]
MKKLLSHDPLTGISNVFHYDPSVDEQNFVIQTVQETTPIIEANKAEMQKSAALGSSGKETLVKVASIPLTVYFELKRKGLTNDPVAMKRWLNDPDNRFFRTREGTI